MERIIVDLTRLCSSRPTIRVYNFSEKLLDIQMEFQVRRLKEQTMILAGQWPVDFHRDRSLHSLD